jgi:hypothetical protein
VLDVRGSISGNDEVFFFTSQRRHPLLSSDQFLAAGPEIQVQFPAVLDFQRSSGSETGSTQPRE